MNRGLGRSGATFMYTIYSGWTPIEEEPETLIIDGNVIPADLNGYAQRVGYETAWILGNVQARAPGLKVKPSTSNRSVASETFVVRFFFPPQTNVTVAVSASDPARAELSHTNLVFTPENYTNAQEVIVRALQRNSGANETYDVQFTTSSADEVFDGLNDSWEFTLPANAVPSVVFTAPADGANLPVGTDLTVSVDSSDPDGSVSSVTLWLNGQQVRQDTSAPYQWSIGDSDSLLANLVDDLYTLKATATDNQGATFTKTISFKAGAPEASPPAAPTGLTVNAFYSAVELNWDDNTEGDLAGYTVYRSTSSGSSGSVIATGLTTSDYTDDTVVNDTTYYYSVTATDVFTNESAHSVKRFATPGTGSVVVQFGTDFDELAGFTTSTPSGTESWSLTADSVHYAFGVLNVDEAHTASLLKSYSLDRSNGSSYSFEGVVDLTDGYGDDNNRIGILLFNDFATQTADGGGGLWLVLNTDGRSIAISSGIKGTSLASGTPTGNCSGDSWIGTTLKFTADLVFTNIGGTDKINLTFTFTDQDDHTDVLTAQVNAADYTGTYFGFATKWRQRGDAASSSNLNIPVDIDYRSFRMTDHNIPEPEGYEAWAIEYNVGVGTDDFDGDGFSNLYEYGLGGNPTNALDRGTLPVLAKHAFLPFFVYTYPKRSDDTNLTYIVEVSTNLLSGQWGTSGYSYVRTDVTGGTLDYVVGTVSPAEKEKFIRLKIEQ